MLKTYKEDERPSLQWYPKDVLTDFGFMACSLAAQGLWMRMLWIMFFADERGKLKANGKQIDNKALAKIIGGDEGGSDTTIIDILIKELEDNGVFSRDKTGTIYCRRMVREAEKEKELKGVRSEAGKKGMEKRWHDKHDKTKR